MSKESHHDGAFPWTQSYHSKLLCIFAATRATDLCARKGKHAATIYGPEISTNGKTKGFTDTRTSNYEASAAAQSAANLCTCMSAIQQMKR